MTKPTGEHFEPRFNHLGITLPKGALNPQARADLTDFYGDVFGWTVYENPDDRNDPLVLATSVFGQFVYLMEGETPMRTDAMDHWGMLVSSEQQLDEILERAKHYQEKDDRVRIIDRAESPQVSRFGPATLVNCYIGFELPLLVELQYVRYDED